MRVTDLKCAVQLYLRVQALTSVPQRLRRRFYYAKTKNAHPLQLQQMITANQGMNTSQTLGLFRHNNTETLSPKVKLLMHLINYKLILTPH